MPDDTEASERATKRDPSGQSKTHRARFRDGGNGRSGDGISRGSRKIIIIEKAIGDHRHSEVGERSVGIGPTGRDGTQVNPDQFRQHRRRGAELNSHAVHYLSRIGQAHARDIRDHAHRRGGAI